MSDVIDLSGVAISALKDLRNYGYAVVIFTPEELNGAKPGKVEDRLVELGWDVIDCLGD